MQKTILLFAAAFALIFVGSLPASAQAKKNGKDIFGYFYFKGKVAKDFADIREIHLAGDFGAKEKPPFYGLIRLKAQRAKDFNLLKPTGAGKNISFTIKVIGGVSYKFTGAFTRLDLEEKQIPESEIVSKGKLTKLKNGQPFAEQSLSFIYFPGS